MIKKLLEDVLLSMTDEVAYYPCVESRDKVEYPGFQWWRFSQGRGKDKYMTNTLYLPVANKPYKEIAENLYEALTDKKVDLFELNNKTRKDLYQVITENPSYSFIRNRKYTEQTPGGL